jgi:hypothetical protein
MIARRRERVLVGRKSPEATFFFVMVGLGPWLSG